MEHTNHLFYSIALLLLVGAGISFISHRLRILPLLGFIIAGVVIGPNALGLVSDVHIVEMAAEIGVVLLLFTIGIEFSLEKLTRIARVIFIGGGTQVVLAIGLSALVMKPFGVDWRQGIFTGCLIALSSTAIVMKLLADKRQTNSPAGQVSLGLLIFQDLAVVAMAIAIPLLGEGSGTWTDLIVAFAKAGGLIAIVLLLARRVMPKILEAVAKTCSQEIFLISVIAICFGSAWVTSMAGVSLSLGAFMAGLLVSESRFGHHAMAEVLPLQILFSSAFFLSVGMLLDLKFVFQNFPLVLLAVGVIYALKLVSTAAGVAILKLPVRRIIIPSFLLAQAGEFSFVLERMGSEVGLFPAGLTETGGQAFIAGTVLLMLFTPLSAKTGEKLDAKLEGYDKGEIKPVSEKEIISDEHRFIGHTVICGFGPLSRALSRDLHAAKRPFILVTLNPNGANEAEKLGYAVLRGNYATRHVLQHAHLTTAKNLVIGDDEDQFIAKVITLAKLMNENLNVFCMTISQENALHLKKIGANVSISSNSAGIDLIRETIFHGNENFGIAGPSGAKIQKKPFRIEKIPAEHRYDSECPHVLSAPEDMPVGHKICEECERAGEKWVHLRVCMVCGHVGCCDTSKNKHATRHYEETGHPIIRSLEDGENWTWCYEDNKELGNQS